MRWLHAAPSDVLDQARNIFVVDGRGESTHKPPTPSWQLPLAVKRLLPPLIVVSALLGGSSTTGSLPSTGSSEPGADEAEDGIRDRSPSRGLGDVYKRQVISDVPVPLLLPSDGVHFMNELVAGSPIYFLDQALSLIHI